MRLYLVRHAIAEAADSDLWPDDAKRPLTARGSRRFRKAAKGLKQVAPDMDVVLSSPHVRAWDTALMLESHAAWPHPEACEQLTADSPAGLLEALQTYEQAQSVALVGHEPYLSRFASVLLAPSSTPFVALRRGGALCIERADVRVSTTGSLVWALPPKVLRALALIRFGVVAGLPLLRPFESTP